MNNALIKQSLTVLVAVGIISMASISALAAELAGTVQGAGKPIAGSTVTLYAAGTGAPAQLAQGKAGDNGAFKLTSKEAPKDSVLYVVAKGGTPKAAADKGPNDAIGLVAVLGTSLPTEDHHQRVHDRGVGVDLQPVHRRHGDQGQCARP